MTNLPEKSSFATPAAGKNPLEQFLAGQLSPRTQRAYRTDLRHFFQFIGLDDTNIQLSAVQRVDFQQVTAYRNHLANEGYKRTSINRKLCSLKAFFKMLVAAGLIDKNPADSTLVRGFRVNDEIAGKAIASQALNQIMKIISSEEDELVRARDMAIFFLLTYGGLRRSEVANIDWKDISQESVFHILHLPETKAGTPQDVKLQPIVVHHLEEYRKVLVQRGYPASGKAFISLSRNGSHGKPLTDQSINLMVKKRALQAGVPRNITAHMFRHTCCTLAIEGGAKPQQVQAHLRHKDLKTTMRYYENREKLLDNASDYIRLG